MRLQEQGRCVPGYGRQPTGCKADHWAERNSVRDNRQYRMHTGQNTERQPENNKLARTHAKVVCHAANGALMELYLHACILRQLLRMAQHHLAVVHPNGSLRPLPRSLYAMPCRPAPAPPYLNSSVERSINLQESAQVVRSALWVQPLRVVLQACLYSLLSVLWLVQHCFSDIHSSRSETRCLKALA